MIHKLRFTWSFSPPEAIMNMLAQFWFLHLLFLGEAAVPPAA